MFERFKEEVKAYLDSLRAEHLLPTDLESPSTARLRDYCLLLCSNGLTNEDRAVMARFFGCQSSDNLENCIVNVDIDRLRPLRNYILGNITRPAEETVKLLAILIDFQPRPYTAWREQYDKLISVPVQDESSLIEGIPTEIIDERVADTACDNDHIQVKELPPNNRFRDLVSFLKSNKVLTYTLSILGLTMSSIWGFKTLSVEDCMCWNGSSYVEVDCKSEQVASKVIALNDNLLKNFQKITRADTLTIEDVGKVWYSKINHRVEFFTGPGFHPIHSHRSLKAATSYVIEKYRKNEE